MTSEIYRDVVRGDTVVLAAEHTSLTDGTEVQVTRAAASVGAAASVLAAIENSPKVPAAWVDELEQLISQGRLRPTCSDPFQESK